MTVRPSALRILAVAFAVLGILPLANLLTHGAVPWWGLAQREWFERGVTMLALTVLIALLLRERVDAVLERARRGLLRVSPGTFGVAVAALAAIGAAFLSRYCFAGQPFTTDEMAQQWHARILLGGHLFAVPEASREFFNTAPVFDRDGHWFSQYPVGGPALVAAGMAFNVAWLVNPLLLGFTVWNLYRFLALAFDELIARATTLLFVLSPMVLIMAASQMSHVPALAFTTLALASLARWDRATERRVQAREAVVIGLATGIVALIRPLDAAVVAAAIGVFQAARLSEDRARASSLAWQVLAAAVPVVLLLWVNARTTGHPLLFGYDALNGPAHRLGFHEDPTGEMHTPRRGLTYVSGYLMRLSRYLFEWPIPGMLFVVAGLLAVRRPTRWDVLLAGLATAITAAYGAYWFDGFFAGPRFLFTALPAFVYFAARAPKLLTASTRLPVARRAASLVVPLCILAAWIGPNGVSSAHGRVALYRDQRTKLKTDVDAQITRARLSNALVFVNEGWRGRLQARLRVLGLSQFRADRALNTLDACAIQTALDVESTPDGNGDHHEAAGERVLALARASGKARLEPGLQGDQAIALVPGKPPTARCIREYLRDSTGTMTYPLFLAHQSVGPDGRVGGNVIFVRDLGEQNALLRNRFGDRAWYVYRPARGLGDTTTAFMPYVTTR